MNHLAYGNRTVVHRAPVCFSCETEITSDPVFAPPFCDCADCGSAVFHGVCLMGWREKLAAERKRYEEQMARHEAQECSCYRPEEQ